MCLYIEAKIQFYKHQNQERKEGEKNKEFIREKINMGGWAIAVHGGAGVDPNLPAERQEEAKQLLTRCLNIGISALHSSLPAIDVVELVVCIFFRFIPLSFRFVLNSYYVFCMS